MSPNVSNFVHDLVEMAQATQRLPEIEAELSRTHADFNRAMDTIAEREQTILKLKGEIEALNQSLRSAEVARDHAETMFLEAEDGKDKALAFVRTLRGNVESMLQAFEPVVPQPVPATPETPPMAVSSSEPLPTGGIADPNPTPASASADGSMPTPAQASETGSGSSASSPVSVEEVALAQPDPSPASSMEAVAQTSAAPSVIQSPDVGSQVPNTIQPDVSPRPTSPVYGTNTSVGTSAEPVKTDAQASGPKPSYAGKLYMRVAGYISRSDWLAGGGTNETYDWRDGLPLPEGVAA